MYNFLPACIDVYHMCAWYPQRSEEDIRSPRLVFRDSWGLHIGAGN